MTSCIFKTWYFDTGGAHNHINFRHIPVIAEALDAFEGGMILVSHVDEFVWQIRMDQYLDLK